MEHSACMKPDVGAEFASLLDQHRRIVLKVAHAYAGDHDDIEGRRILRGFIDAQDPLNRAVLVLYLEERSYAEMSEILGVSETSLTTKINRLKERLRSYAEGHHGTR
jgi:DNA-directed RNA polymerase specialized sigma subunit